jgi:hypothetical protein
VAPLWWITAVDMWGSVNPMLSGKSYPLFPHHHYYYYYLLSKKKEEVLI